MPKKPSKDHPWRTPHPTPNCMEPNQQHEPDPPPRWQRDLEEYWRLRTRRQLHQAKERHYLGGDSGVPENW